MRRIRREDLLIIASGTSGTYNRSSPGAPSIQPPSRYNFILLCMYLVGMSGGVSDVRLGSPPYPYRPFVWWPYTVTVSVAKCKMVSYRITIRPCNSPYSTVPITVGHHTFLPSPHHCMFVPTLSIFTGSCLPSFQACRMPLSSMWVSSTSVSVIPEYGIYS